LLSQPATSEKEHLKKKRTLQWGWKTRHDCTAANAPLDQSTHNWGDFVETHTRLCGEEEEYRLCDPD
jgi:hypothetical protein